MSKKKERARDREMCEKKTMVYQFPCGNPMNYLPPLNMKAEFKELSYV